ncbi:3-deoxy-7-phosphoheptulonate synthase [Candidatus Sumerlaeota bacterium]|nr:3-deoxy-7-phosphoheptulonate synthase [Candidatus Sumerlaeota bacterium]
MIISMQPDATKEQLDAVFARIEELGYKSHPIFGEERTVIGVVGRLHRPEKELFEGLDGVDTVVYISKPFKLVSKELKREASVFDIGGVKVGGTELMLAAGPCSVESEAQIVEIAREVKAGGAKFLRGGAYKPRTSPFSFQGLGREGLEFMATARAETGLKIVTEVLSIKDIDLVAEYADVIQIGARNCQNFALLEAVGKARKPVLYKRGMSTTVNEWLQAADYILDGGNEEVILCERGIRTFETATRNTLDTNAVALVKEMSHLPIIVDPSHATGHDHLVIPAARAGIAAGADGLIIEVHTHPEKAWSDGHQCLRPARFRDCVAQVRRIAEAMGRTIG